MMDIMFQLAKCGEAIENKEVTKVTEDYVELKERERAEA